ncbi:xanthine dehydrogenase family protein subunit M [Mycoplasmatota bacterium]|nr:xanthine dehydrogenase family protein subunit M [Mycoplasmatota bacterium]
MIMNNSSAEKFFFESFSTLKETSEFLVSKGNVAMISAGSTDVLVHTQKRGFPNYIVSLNQIQDLNYVNVDKNEVRIGSLTTLTEISESQIIIEKFPALSKAAGQVGSPQIRNRATIAGNLCNASPAADTAPALLVYDAKLKIFNQGNERIVELSEFFVGPGKTILENGDIVIEIILPIQKKSVSSFVKIGKRKALEISIMSMAMSVEIENNIIKSAKVACGSVAPKPVLINKTAKSLVGLEVKDELDLVNAIEIIKKEVTPIDDIRGTANYRLHMLGVTLKRMVLELVRSEA